MKGQTINISNTEVSTGRKRRTSSLLIPLVARKGQIMNVFVFAKGNINPNSSGCLVSLSTPGQPAVHKGPGRERGQALVAPVPWRCVSRD